MGMFKEFIDHIKRFVAMDKKDCCCASPKAANKSHYDMNGDCMVVDDEEDFKPKKKVAKPREYKNIRKSGKGRKK